jgi:hypothetical protein
MATQIVIAAQAQEKGVKGNKNSLAFSHLNGGLTNRLSPTRVEAAEDSSSTKPDESTLSKYLELRSQLEAIYQGLSTEAVVTEEVAAAENERIGVDTDENGITSIPEDKIKEKMKLELNRVYDKLFQAAKDLKVEADELTNLNTAKNNALAAIDAETDFLTAFPTNPVYTFDEKTKIYKGRQQVIVTYVYGLLEAEYDDFTGYRSDTPIEAVWTAIAEKDTGDYVSGWF